MRIEICGGIGSGKTTLASIINGKKLSSVYENFKLNPFWEAFYSNPRKHSFETEVTFLLQHYHQIKNARGEKLIFDFSLYQDLAFAKMGLAGNRLNIFENIFNECLDELGPPDLTIYLACSSEILLKRITKRARPEEKLISIDFLNSLNAAIYSEFKNLVQPIRTIMIESDKEDFASNEFVRESLRKRILES